MHNKFKFKKETDVRVLSEKYVYEGFFKVKDYILNHRLFMGGWSKSLTREVAIRQPVAACLPYDPKLDQVVLIEQFRVGALKANSPWLLEIVAGIEDKNDSHAEDIIRREMKEEAGLTPLELKKIYEYWVSPGGSNEFLTLYCAKVDSSEAGGVHGLEEECEDIYVHVIKTEEAFDLLERDKIKNAMTIIAIQWLQLNKDKLDRFWKDEQ